jgi:hypothetical protein
MSQAPSEPRAQADLLASLRAAGAARWDAVGWHYIETLAERAGAHSGPSQALLNAKLTKALAQLKAKLDQPPMPSGAVPPGPSPLALLLRDMARHAPAVPSGLSALSAPGPGMKTSDWRAESPQVQQFKKQLQQLRVQKQVTQAIAQAPHNAGPINSHMLVLRSLALMRGASTDYLNRFMAHVDTLFHLDASGAVKPASRKSSAKSSAP